MTDTRGRVESLLTTCIDPGSFDQAYKLKSTNLGSGSGGTVCKAACRKAGENVAVKSIHAHVWMKSDANKLQVLNEVHLMRHVVPPHENVIGFKHAFITNGRLDIVMELCEEGDLFCLIAARKSLSESEAAFGSAQLLRGLAHLHAHGIVHRDVKPENVLVKRIPPAQCAAGDDGWQAQPCTFDLSSTSHGRYVIKITDFGFGHAIGEPLAVQSLVGTLGYLAPEVPLRGDYSPKSDVWAVGVILYIMLCGYPPFWGPDSDMWRNIKAVRWAMHEKYWGGISPDAKSLVAQLMATDPARRPACTEALMHTFLSQRQSNKELPASTMQSLRRLNARRRLRAAVMAVMWGQRLHRFRLQQLRACLPEAGCLTDSQLKGIVTHFNAATAGLGTADASALGSALRSVGLPDMPATVFAAFDSDSNGQVDVKEFVVALSLLCAQGEAAAGMAFDMFDANGDGHLSQQEVTALVQATAGPHMGQGPAGKILVSEVMTVLDKNGDGVITRAEFLRGAVELSWIREQLLAPLRLQGGSHVHPASGPGASLSLSSASGSTQGPLVVGLSGLGSGASRPHSRGGAAGTASSSSSSGMSSVRVGGVKRAAAAAPAASATAAKLRRQDTGGGGGAALRTPALSRASAASSLASSCAIQ